MTSVDTDLDQIMNELAEDMRLTHIVTPADNQDIWDILGGGAAISGKDIVSFARYEFREVTALCGFRWIPKNDPTKYDTCEACLEEAHRRMAE